MLEASIGLRTRDRAEEGNGQPSKFGFGYTEGKETGQLEEEGGPPGEGGLLVCGAFYVMDHVHFMTI